MDTEDELAAHLAALERDACYRVDAVLKQGPLEVTERVFFVGENGSELGPFVRKRIGGGSGLGGAYERLFAAQRRGVRCAHLPRLLECHRRDGDLVVVMEHVPGQTLGSRVEACRGPAARLELVRRVFPELCDAVSELHERMAPPVIHRDLKPGNVMVSPGGVTLIDLGIARAYRPGAEQDTVHFGTRAYAPPEQFGFGQTDVTSDVYALGMLLFFCVAGREPRAADREGGFSGAGVPEALRSVIARATELDPAARYASVRDLRAAFLEACAHVPGGDGGAVPEPPDLGAAAAAARPSRPGRTGGPLSRVPRWLGVAWDVLAAAGGLAVAAACVWCAVVPMPETAGYPTWYRVCSYLVCAMPMTLVGTYLLMDRRPLRRLVPRLEGRSVARETARGLGVMGALLAVWVVATLAMMA